MSPSASSSDPVVLSAARWFWWIAGLSLVNTALFHSGSQMNFVVGLGLTTVLNEIFANDMAVALACTGLTVGFYFWIGVMAQRERTWAFYVGLVVYALDAVIFIVAQDWMPVAFHALALYSIAKGVMRLRLDRQATAASV